MHLFLTIKAIDIQLNVNIKILTNGGADQAHAQLLYHYAVKINQLFGNPAFILVHLVPPRKIVLDEALSRMKKRATEETLPIPQILKKL
jgi:hypothetical protein